MREIEKSSGRASEVVKSSQFDLNLKIIELLFPLKKFHKILWSLLLKPFVQSYKLAVSAALASGWLPAGLSLISATPLGLCSESSAAVRSSYRLCARASSYDSSDCAPCLQAVERSSRRDLQFLMECVGRWIEEGEWNHKETKDNRWGFQLGK